MTRAPFILMVATCVCLLLAGCDNSDQKELRQELDALVRDAKGRIEPLPQIKPYTPQVYDQRDARDPFSPNKIAEVPRANKQVKNSHEELYAFHQKRAKEPLESYALDTLKMVGTLERKGTTYALVRVNQSIFRVKVGNYMGQDLGLITRIAPDQIELKELVLDGEGGWAERAATITLQENEGPRR